MEKFTKIEGVAAPMPLVNIDTDMIIPKQFLKTIKRTGLGVNLFDEMRFNSDGSEVADFVLNQPAGIRVVIAPSFADIFFNNCFKNGILPIALPQEDVDKLMADAERGANATLTVDPFKKHCLLNGLDDIGLTMEKASAIDRFEASAKATAPWLAG